MGKDRIKIKYTLMNYSTNSVISGVIMVKGQKFHDVSDTIKGYIEDRMSKLLHQNHPAEDPRNWIVLGFQPWSEWHKRARRAKEMMA